MEGLSPCARLVMVTRSTCFSVCWTQLKLEAERKERQKQKEKERKLKRKLEGKPVTRKEREAEARRQAHLAALQEQGI